MADFFAKIKEFIEKIVAKVKELIAKLTKKEEGEPEETDA